MEISRVTGGTERVLPRRRWRTGWTICQVCIARNGIPFMLIAVSQEITDAIMGELDSSLEKRNRDVDIPSYDLRVIPIESDASETNPSRRGRVAMQISIPTTRFLRKTQSIRIESRRFSFATSRLEFQIFSAYRRGTTTNDTAAWCNWF